MARLEMELIQRLQKKQDEQVPPPRSMRNLPTCTVILPRWKRNNRKLVCSVSRSRSWSRCWASASHPNRSQWCVAAL